MEDTKTYGSRIRFSFAPAITDIPITYFCDRNYQNYPNGLLGFPVILSGICPIWLSVLTIKNYDLIDLSNHYRFYLRIKIISVLTCGKREKIYFGKKRKKSMKLNKNYIFILI